MSEDITTVVAAAFRSYLAQDRAAAGALYADDFRFTSPQDDRLDRATFFERCFPTADHFVAHRLLQVTAAADDLVFAYYEYQLRSGARHRNVEAITVRDGQIHETQVFFGGRVD